MKLNTKNMRKRAGMTQRPLAKAIGVNLSTIGNWERGVTYPDAAQVWDCAVALGCTPNDIMGWEEETDGRREEIGRIYDSMDGGGRADLLNIARSLSKTHKGSEPEGMEGVA